MTGFAMYLRFAISTKSFCNTVCTFVKWVLVVCVREKHLSESSLHVELTGVPPHLKKEAG